MDCQITSPEETITHNKVLSITLPGYTGMMQVLPGHAEAFVALKTGEIILEFSHKPKQILKIVKGECYIKENLVTIIL